VKIAIKYPVIESWNPRPFMAELNRTARNVMIPKSILAYGIIEINAF
jgi:hypothetical protein